MNNREAIALLRNLEDSLGSYCELNEEGKTAFRMAIEALSCSDIPNNSDTISRQQAFDALHCRFADGFEEDRWWNSTHVIAALKGLPAVPPERKGTRLSTVCLLCKKPAVTFNTEDDIPYTNYSYCEDCLRKGLKLLREQNKNLQTQPERKTGRWIPVTNGRGGHQCDKCGSYAPSYKSGAEWLSNFCPECNADMKGETNE